MMALSSAIALLVFAALLLSAAAAPAVAPAPVIGQPGCNTTCGGVRVPYPFGLGPEHCSWPGFNLTCDTTGRLLLGDGTLRVDHIFLGNTSVRVVRTGSIINESTGNSTSDGWSFPFGTSFAGSVYELHTNNELVLFGCSLAVTLVESAAAGESNPKISAGCFSICASSFVYSASKDKLCSNVGCCQVNIVLVGRPNAVQLRSSSLSTAGPTLKSPLVFIAEKGWFDRNGKRNKAGIPVRPKRPAVLRVPFMLSWGAPPGNAGLPKRNSGEEVCPGNTSRVLCKSDHSKCRSYSRGYVCYCMDGYNGNPYLAGGCQDIDECKKPREQIRCFGDCINMNGTYKCRCPKGTRGNHSLPGGCIPIPADPVLVKPPSEGVVIGIAVGSGVGSILLVLIVVLITQRFKYLREKNMKQKYFKQNRGQLLQQLVSQNACIAERMIIPMDELAKATNNFDKARELGGGGHGMVYKGILSNQHVVAIKKSKITVQREIDEFINEVAILSQINHRNVVKLFGCCLETEVPLLVYEFISNGTLYQHLHVEGPRSLPWGSRLRIAVETSSALAYLHSSVSTPIIHRDIKSSNILLDDTLTSKVSDFGASRYIPIEKAGLTTRVQGTIGYLDPMCFYTGRLTEKSDVYSFGVMLVELLTRKKPFSYLSLDDEGLVSHFVNLLQQDNLVQLLDPQVVEEGGKEVQEIAILAASCIKLTSEDRPRMQQVELVLKGIAARIIEENGTAVMNCWTTTEEGQRSKESSRRYSMEKEFLLSASYPR